MTLEDSLFVFTVVTTEPALKCDQAGPSGPNDTLLYVSSKDLRPLSVCDPPQLFVLGRPVVLQWCHQAQSFHPEKQRFFRSLLRP